MTRQQTVTHELQPGEVFAERYRIERIIGAGGFARIYRAVQQDLDRTVALKILAPTSMGSSREKVQKRFYREARILSRLQDPHTVTVYDYGTAGSVLYMVLEHIEGRDLAEIIGEEGPLEPERARGVLVQMLHCLREVHAQGLLHRDIKPSNVMLYDRLGQTDCVKVLDFGVAKGHFGAGFAKADLTAEGAVVGTPKYMSPEQLNGIELEPASDLFGVGLVLYEMIAGRSPYQDRELTDIYRRMLAFSDDLGPLESLPEDLRRVAGGLLAPSLDDRYASAGAALRDLGVELEPVEDGESNASRGSGGAPPSFPLELDPSGATPSSAISAVTDVDAEMMPEPATTDELAESPVEASQTAVGVPESGAEPGNADPTVVERRSAEEITTADAPDLGEDSELGEKRWPILAVGAVVLVGAGLLWAVWSGGEAPGGSGGSGTDTDRSADGSSPGVEHAVEAAGERARNAFIAGTSAADAAADGVESAASEEEVSGGETDRAVEMSDEEPPSGGAEPVDEPEPAPERSTDPDPEGSQPAPSPTPSEPTSDDRGDSGEHESTDETRDRSGGEPAGDEDSGESEFEMFDEL